MDWYPKYVWHGENISGLSIYTDGISKIKLKLKCQWMIIKTWMIIITKLFTIRGFLLYGITVYCFYFVVKKKFVIFVDFFFTLKVFP